LERFRDILTLPLLVPGYLLVLFRVAGLVMAAPLFGSNAIPTHLRVLFAAAIALMVFPAVLPMVPADLTIPAVLAGVVSEIMIGLVMGVAIHAVFAGAELAGVLVGQQGGLSLGQTYNPAMDESTTALGQLYFIVLFLIFVLAGGHRAVIGGLLDSFRAIPLLSFGVDESHIGLIAELLQSACTMALRLAGPCLIAMFMTTIALGFLSKTMPQLNVLSVGFMVRIVVLFVVGGLALSGSQGVFDDGCYDALVEIRAVLGLN